MLVPWRLQEGIVLFLFIDEAANSMLVTPKKWRNFSRIAGPEVLDLVHVLKPLGLVALCGQAAKRNVKMIFHMMKHIIFNMIAYNYG